MAYDSARGVTVLYGGFDGAYSDETWEWDGETWAPREVEGGPGPRIGHAMAYNVDRAAMVLFGGNHGSQRFDDTWEWDGASWTERDVSGPVARRGHAMIYDRGRATVVLFGGLNDPSRLDDTWALTDDRWTLVETCGPSGRHGHAMAYDDDRWKTVLFGGDAGAFSSETWEMDSAYVPCVRDPAWLCDGDVDGDGQVNPVDAGLVQSAFGSICEQELCQYDLDCDGQVNPVDAGIVQALFGTCNAPRETCP
jgi:hypothetical protein